VKSVFSSAVATGMPLTKKNEVDAAGVGGREVDLPHHPEAHLLVTLDRRGILGALGLRLAHGESRRGQLESTPQDVQCATAVGEWAVEHLHQAVEQLALLLRAVRTSLDNLGEFVRLGSLEPINDVLGEQRPFAVVALVVGGVQPAMGGKVLAKFCLEGDFVKVSQLPPPPRRGQFGRSQLRR
jgi:hypothetical protein